MQRVHQPQLDRVGRAYLDLRGTIRGRGAFEGPRPQLRRHLLRDLPDLEPDQGLGPEYGRVHRASVREIPGDPWSGVFCDQGLRREEDRHIGRDCPELCLF
ncbi:hypothetical protein T310_8043 [Rasamsonia emersonii CBS 393.64]|uniref:Uncharacterized protein n=1 Tax=Rasamsonia emersonii (strain ATCC 16479 / CBS 393.64 / IMI 116815) TaxID=1408163 RepID=A0A0F4YJD5_RASE3|nr:hypothetical protein T310_8043 [Rasamsonia emersonii CBS 393.64]KKA18001.1 hypothetical protein T310_8043 [Rasamsonia emersonii CBS 393.64]